MEDAATKPMWRDSYRAERCLIPADGWNEWSGMPVIACAVLTRKAPAPLSEIHARMPLVLPPAAFKDWLNPSLRSADEIAALVAGAVEQFSHYPVSPELTAASHDDAQFVKPLPLKSAA